MFLVGVGHFGFVLFAKTSRPIWPTPVTPSDFAFFPLRSKKAKPDLQKDCYTGLFSFSAYKDHKTKSSPDRQHHRPGHDQRAAQPLLPA
jgi:hypothetical protein